MSYDLYAKFGGNSRQDVNDLVDGKHNDLQIPDIAGRIRLLAGIAAYTYNKKVKDYAVSGDHKRGGGYKSLVHKKGNVGNTPYAKELIAPMLDQMKNLGIQPAAAPQMDILPPGSWFLQFTFILAKPWMSKDDDIFYVAEGVNPTRKDKVFKVPMMSAGSWKGLLRWTLMHTRLAQKKDKANPQQFATERFAQTLLFGDEKGEEPGQKKGIAAYLDKLLPEARADYERMLRQYYKVEQKDPLPHHSGRLLFYPTFFDLIDVEVINPHSRKTKAGTHPIYLECVPAGARGTFSLLYIPLDRIGQDKTETRRQAAEDLKLITRGLQAMFLTYGFSAKRSSGYGIAKERLDGEGKLIIKAELTGESASAAAAPEPQQPALPRYLESPTRLHADLRRLDGSLKSEAEYQALIKSRGQKYGKKVQQRYAKARGWWERKGKALTAQLPEPTQSQPQAAPPAPQWTEYAFGSFDQLREKAAETAQRLQTGGAV